jgi:hypothetical protein
MIIPSIYLNPEATACNTFSKSDTLRLAQRYMSITMFSVQEYIVCVRSLNSGGDMKLSRRHHLPRQVLTVPIP